MPGAPPILASLVLKCMHGRGTVRDVEMQISLMLGLPPPLELEDMMPPAPAAFAEGTSRHIKQPDDDQLLSFDDEPVRFEVVDSFDDEDTSADVRA